jgi:hypothetical protein
MSETENTEIVGTTAPAVSDTTRALQVLQAEIDAASAVAAGVAPQAQAGPEAKPRRRIRGGTLLTAAVVLGVLGGVATGYAVQWSRPATPLPSLAGSQPRYKPVGVYQGIAPAMLPAAQDDATLTEGDLTKLMLPVPSGASTADSAWVDQLVDLEQDASLCTDEAACLKNDYTEGIDAIADTNWTQNGLDVEITMYRMAPGDSDNVRSWASTDTGAANQIPMPAGIDASGQEFRDSYGYNDDNAFAAHGDIVVEFWVDSSSVIPNPSVIDGLITQQMGRL